MKSSDYLLDVSVIIPFYNQSAMTIACLKSLKDLSLKEIFLVSNNSTPEEVSAVQNAIDKFNISRAKILVYNRYFNIQKINNWGASQSTGKVIWLLNNDVEIPPESIKLVNEMYQKALQPDVGGVGCVLLYGDNETIQHAGAYLVPGGYADNLYSRKKYADIIKNADGSYYNISEPMQVSALSTASLMVEKSKFDSIHGMNPEIFTNGGDVDLCLRLNRNGFYSWLMGAKYGYMLHKESQTIKNHKIPYSDFTNSYASYIQDYDSDIGYKYIDTERLK